MYQIILPSPSGASEGPKIYVAQNNNIHWLDFDTYTLIPDLNVTYETNAGDSVLIEYNCLLYLDPIGTSLINIYFELDEGYASTFIALEFNDYMKIPALMKHYIQNSTAGEHMVQILTYINEEYTNSYVDNSFLTVTVF